MYRRINGNIHIDLSFTQRQAVERVVKSRGWSQWSFDFEDGVLVISEYKSLKKPLLVLTAECRVAQDTLLKNGNYVLSDALKSFNNKINEIWFDIYE